MATRPGIRRWAWLAVLAAVAGCQWTPAQQEAMRKFSAARRPLKRSPAAAELAGAMAGVDDTARIVYVAMVGNYTQIMSVQPDGRRGVQLTNDPGYKCRPSWRPDHRALAFFRYAGDRPVDPLVSVVIMQHDGTGAVEMIRGKRIDPAAARLSWKPDGSLIYLSERDFPSVLYGYSTLTGDLKETVRIPRGSFLKEAHTLSPDLALISGSGPDRKTHLNHIGTVPRLGGKDTDLMRFFQAAKFHTGTVVWSYDSRWVAFELDEFVLVMSSYYHPGFRVYPITSMEIGAAMSGPAFSPTGQSIACILEKTQPPAMGSGDREVRSDVWVMRVDGSQPRALTTSGSCFDPHW